MATYQQNLDNDQMPQFDNSGHGKLVVPGFGCKLETILPPGKRFRHGIMDALYDRLTAKELAMLRLMDAITDKPNWKIKVRKLRILEKWRAEAMTVPFMSDAAFDWCIEELQDNTDWDEESFVVTLNTSSRCAKGDGVIPKTVLQNLQSQILPLLRQPKDWHPDSNEQVLNLVHPSLYPLIYAKTRIKPKGRVGLTEVVIGDKSTVVIPATTDSFPDEWHEWKRSVNRTTMLPAAPDRSPDPWQDWQRSLAWSHKFQWLPCEVKFEEDFGTRVKITSYINNLRPDLHKDLYRTIEEIIGYSIPTWNQVLLRSTPGRTSRRIDPMDTISTQYQWTKLTYEPPRPDWLEGIAHHKGDARWEDDLKKVKEYIQLPEVNLSPNVNHRHHQYLHDRARIYRGPGPFHWENGDESDSGWLWSVVDAKYLHVRKLVHPDPGPETYQEWKRKQWDARQWDPKHQTEGEEPNPYPISLENEFRKQGLQVIVKLASIELTPEKPEYPGGNWHLEGSLSEHIVATAIYYFDVQNVSESRIRFRQAVIPDTNGQRQESYPGLTDFVELWGLSQQEIDVHAAAVQEIGSIKTPHGRLLAFPNTLQHRVEPFKLLDPTKSGHRRILVLWLVDPNYRIMSTQNVPPQQPEWQSDRALKILSCKRRPRLPPEVLTIIGQKLDEVASFPLKEAKKYRRKLMQERGVLMKAADDAAVKYSLCEH